MPHSAAMSTVFSTHPPSIEYRLTPLGKMLLEPLRVLVRWADGNHDAIKSDRQAFEGAPFRA